MKRNTLKRGVALLAALAVAVPLTMFIVSASPARAAGPEDEGTYVAPLADPALEARARALQKELRCLVCQGESIDESNAPLATDLRRLIRQQMQAGKSDDDIKNFLVARYGAFVLMNPPVQQDTFLLWFGPFLLVVLGGSIIGLTILRSRRRLALEPAED